MILHCRVNFFLNLIRRLLKKFTLMYDRSLTSFS